MFESLLFCKQVELIDDNINLRSGKQGHTIQKPVVHSSGSFQEVWFEDVLLQACCVSERPAGKMYIEELGFVP